MTKHNKIGFNNFKSFGDKLQTFSQKPLTLVFGPNSIGKSSFLHFLLYIDYIKQSGELDLTQSDFAGDSLDFGGFANFIHKKDANKSIDYQLILTKTEDISKYFSLIYTEAKKFAATGIFEQNIDKSTIVNRLSLYKKRYENDFITFTSTKRSFDNLIKSPILTKKEKNQLSVEHDKYYNEYTKLIIDSIVRSDNLGLDKVDNFILHLLDYKNINIFEKNVDLIKVVDKIFGIIKLYDRISKIFKISIEYKFSFNPKKTYTNRYLIDNELIYTYDSSTGKIETNYDSELMHLFKNSGFLLDNMGPEYDMEYVSDLLRRAAINPSYCAPNHSGSLYFSQGNHLNTLTNSINSKVSSELKKLTNIQYLGPLRYFPQRIDLVEDLSIKCTSSANCQKEQFEQLSVRLFKIKRFIPSFLRETYLSKRIISIINLKILAKMAFNTTTVRDSRNFFKSNKNKLTSGNSKNSQQIWSEFINDSTSQQQLNDWLSDETKLKTQYTIKKVEKNNMFSRISGLKDRVLVFVDKRTGTEVTPREMGLGISQVLPILVASMSLKDHKIFIEQPELHLHPAVQCELADEFIRSMKTRNNEFIIESHSEHLLLRIMKRMRQTAEGTLAKNDALALTPDDICLLYVDHNGQHTHINELELDTDGSLLDPWPHGFFEEGYKERFA